MMDPNADASAHATATAPAASTAAGADCSTQAQAHGPGCGCGCQEHRHHHSDHGHHGHHAEQQTLHDFVLNLIVDHDAKNAFLLDPQSCLQDAGLGDLSLADVHDVLTLVLDSIPVSGPAALGQLDGLNLGSATAEPGAVIAQLQDVLQQVGVTNSHSASQDVNVLGTATSAVLPTVGALGLGAEVLPGIGVAASGSGAVLDLSGTHDLANTLDGTVLGTAVGGVAGTTGLGDPGGLGVVDGVVGTTTGLVDGVLGGSPVDGLLGGSPVDGVLGTVHGVVGNTVGGLLGNGIGGAVGSVVGATTGDGVTGLLGNAVNGIAAGTLGGVLGTPPVSGVVGTVHGAVGDTVGGVAGNTVGDSVTGTAGNVVHGTGLDSVTGSVGSTVQGVTGADAHGLLGGVTGTVGGTVQGLTGTDAHGLLGGVTGTVGDTLGSAGVGNVTGDPSGQSHADVSTQVDASHHGLLDGLH